MQALREQILPDIIARHADSDRRLRLWSAGCATGEEPYSLAILLNELIQDLESWSILILATDIDQQALDIGRKGRYGAWSFRGVEDAIKESYFQPDLESTHRLDPRLRQMVTFRTMNLVSAPTPTEQVMIRDMDLILCRNVTIYFRAPVAESVMRRLSRSLCEGGWLLPGASEAGADALTDLDRRSYVSAVAYCRRQSAHPPAKAPKPAPAWATVPRNRDEKVQGRPSQPVHSEGAADVASSLERPRVLAWDADAGDPSQVISQVRRMLAANDSGAAEEMLRMLQVDQPIPPRSKHDVALIHADLGNLAESRRWCERAIEEDRVSPEPYFSLAMVCQAEGDDARAIDALSRVLYLSPNCALAHLSIGHLYRRRGDLEKGNRHLAVATRLVEEASPETIIPLSDGVSADQMLKWLSVGLERE